MSELILRLSERFAVEDVSAIRAALGRHLRVRNPRFMVRQSIDPPSTIQLLGAVAAWQILVKPAAAFIKAFFSTLGKKSAEAAWDLVAARKKNPRGGSMSFPTPTPSTPPARSTTWPPEAADDTPPEGRGPRSRALTFQLHRAAGDPVRATIDDAAAELFRSLIQARMREEVSQLNSDQGSSTPAWTSIGSTPQSDRPDARKQVGMISELDRADRKPPPD